MTYSKKQIVAELMKRGEAIPQSFQYLEQMIKEERGEIPTQPKSKLESIRDAMKLQSDEQSAYDKAMGLGLTQGIGSTGANIPNAVLSPLAGHTGNFEVSQPNLQENIPEYPGAETVFQGGNLLGKLGSEYALYRGLGKLPGLKGSGAFPESAKIFGATYLGEPGNMMQRLKEALITGSIPLAGKVAAEAVKYAPHLPTALSNTKTGESVVKGFKAEKELATKGYNSMFKEAADLGVERVPLEVENKIVKSLIEELPESYSKKLELALENPSFENMHWAQSDLLKFAEKMKNSANATSSKIEAGKRARELSEKIQDAMFRELVEKGGIDPALRYIELGENYAGNVIPHLSIKSIKGASKKPGSKGYIEPKYIPAETETKAGSEFRSGVGKKYPELELNRALTIPYKALKAILGRAI